MGTNTNHNHKHPALTSVLDLEVNTQRKQVLTKSGHVVWPVPEEKEDSPVSDEREGSRNTKSNKYAKVCRQEIVDVELEKYNSSKPHVGEAARNLLQEYDDFEAAVDWGSGVLFQ